MLYQWERIFKCGWLFIAFFSVTFLSNQCNADAKQQNFKEIHPQFVNSGNKAGVKVWRIENFEPVLILDEDFGTFYRGDSYLVLHTIKDSKGDLSHNIYTWIGKHSTADEYGSAAILSVFLNDYLKGRGKLIRLEDGKESADFKSLFKNFKTLKGGVDSGFNHVTINDFGEKKLYQIKGEKDIGVIYVDLNIKSLNKEDCFVLDAGKEIYNYIGPKANSFEKLKAIAVANSIRDVDHSGRSHVTIIDSSSSKDELDEFFKALGSVSTEQIAEDSGINDKEFKEKLSETTVLYRLSKDGDKVTKEIVDKKPYKKAILKSENCYILDTITSGIFVWIGNKSDTLVRVNAMRDARVALAEDKAPSWVKVERVVENGEPTIFRQYFIDW